MKIFVGCSSRENIKEEYKDLARSVATWINQNHYDLLLGGSSTGMMGVCYQECKESKIETFVAKAYEQDIQRLNHSKNHIVDTTMERFQNLYANADILLFLPGGSGTFSELLSALEEFRTNKTSKKIILFNYKQYYDGFLTFLNRCIKENFNDETIYSCFEVVTNIEELEKKVGEIICKN